MIYRGLTWLNQQTLVMLMEISSGNQSGNPLDNIYIYILYIYIHTYIYIHDVPIKTSIVVVVVFFQPATFDYPEINKIPKLGKSKQLRSHQAETRSTQLCPNRRRALETTFRRAWSSFWLV